MPATAYTHLLSPLTITHPGGELRVRNRVLVSAHVPGFAQNNLPGKDYINYHRRYAAEGVGLQITGGTPVHPSGLLSHKKDSLWNMDDSIVPGYRKLGEAVHAEGGCILAQLAHSGGTVQITEPGITPWSASAIRSAITGHVSHAMSVAEIQEVIQAFVDAADRVRQGGLDGVEILAAFGFLPQAFLSPLTNFRSDQYGGTLENRMRFLLELLRSVRTVLGANQILGVRLPGDEFEPGGLTLGDMQAVSQVLVEEGLVDYLNVIAHTNFTHTGRSRHWPPTPARHGLFVDLAAAIKSKISVPVFTVGRIIDPMLADQIVARKLADMVGMTRAHICDPAIVRKITFAEPDRIRPCVGANTCIANRYAGKPIRCMHHPELKNLDKGIQKTDQVQRVVVIGAGPAGLEAARLCAERGHQVRIFEKAANPGGQLRYWASVTSTSELAGIINWRLSELKRLGVVIELNREITTTDITTLKADQVILATGATTEPRVLAGNNAVPVLSPVSLLDKGSISARTALIISDGRGQAGLVCAEFLLDQNVSVEIISEDIAVANDLDPTHRNAWYARLGQQGVIFTAHTVLSSVQDDNVLLRDIYSDRVSHRHGIDLIVDWNGAKVQDTLKGIVANNAPASNIHVIGDCKAPRNVELAMAEALMVAEKL